VERTEARKTALLALNWELEANQGLLDHATREPQEGTLPLLTHIALDNALPWIGSLSPTMREAQLALVRYNAEAEA
jgi:hypothetical protein